LQWLTTGYFGRVLCGNHDLGKTRHFIAFSASVCASNQWSKAMVHCICTCDIQLWHVILYLWLYYLLTGRLRVIKKFSGSSQSKTSSKLATHETDNIIAYTTHTYAIQHNKQSSIPAI